MAVRQASATTGKPKRPRIQAIVSERLLAKIEAYAKKNGWSVSRTVEEICSAYLDGWNPEQDTNPNPSSRPAEGTYELKKTEPDEAEKLMKLMQMMKLAKESGLL